VARKSGRIAELPTARPRKALPLKKATWFVYRDAGRVLLERRPSPGIWGGLWCFPEIEDAAFRVRSRRILKPIDHGFTHFRLRIQPLLCDVKSRESPGRLWLDLSDARAAAIPTPVKNLLQDLQRNATRSARSRR
jgi:A/G-specific adenine glycosylase